MEMTDPSKFEIVEAIPLEARLLGQLGYFVGLSKYNETPMLITKIDYARERLIVESGIGDNHLPTFASLPHAKLTQVWLDANEFDADGMVVTKNMLTVAALRAPNLADALASSGLDAAVLSCVKYHAHPTVPLRGYEQQHALADATGGTVVFGHYVYACAPSDGSKAYFSSEKTPMLKDRHGNHVEVLPDIDPKWAMTMRLFVEDPSITFASMQIVKSTVLPALMETPAEALEMPCFPFASTACFSPAVKHDHARLVESRKTPRATYREEVAMIDRRTFAALAAECVTESHTPAGADLVEGVLLTRFSPAFWPLAHSLRACACCGVFTHLDVVSCRECHAAHYCSKLCRKHHAREHKKACQRPGWAAERRAAAAARAERLARCEAHAAAEAAADRAAAAARKRAAEAARERRALEGEKPYTLPGASHKPPKPKQARPPKTMAEATAALRFREEKPLRAAAFDARQQRAHGAAVARRAEAKAALARAAEAAAAKDREAARHVVPPKPTLVLG